MKNVTKTVVLSITALLVLLALVLGGWQAGWWFNVQNHKRQSQIINIDAHNLRNGYANQQTLRDQITQLIGNITSINVQIVGVDKSQQQALAAQRYAIVNQLCGNAAQVRGDPLTGEQATFVAQNCSAGVVAPNSQYAPQP